MNTFIRRITWVAAVVAAVLLTVGPPAGATDAEWIGPAGGATDWHNSSNWETASETNVVPNGVGDTATFADLVMTTTSALTVDIDPTDVTLGGLHFSGEDFINDVTIADNFGGESLTFDNGGTGAVFSLDMRDPGGEPDSIRKVTVEPSVVLADDLTIDLGGHDIYSDRHLDLVNPVTESGSHKLTVDGMQYADRLFNTRGMQWMVGADVTVSELDVAGGRFVQDTSELNVTADTSVSGGEVYVGAGKTMNLDGTLEISDGRFNIGLDGNDDSTLSINQSSVSVSGGTLAHYGKIVWDNASEKGDINVSNGGSLSTYNSDTSADQNSLNNIESFSVDGTSNITGDDSFMSGLTVGDNLTLSEGAMLSHESFAVNETQDDLETLVDISASSDKYVYGITGHTSNVGSFDANPRETGDEWSLTLGTGSSGRWMGIGADTVTSQQAWQAPEPIYFGVPETQDGDPADVINVSGDFVVRTTEPVLVQEGYGLMGRGPMLVGAKLTGGASGSTLDVQGSGMTILANANNDVQGTWNVDGGALRVNLYANDINNDTMSVLGDSDNDIELSNGATLTFRAGTAQKVLLQDATMETTRTLGIGTGGGRVYLNPVGNAYVSGSAEVKNPYGGQSVIDNEGKWNEDRGPGKLPTTDPFGLEILRLPGDGQLTGSGDLTVEGGNGVRMVVGGSNSGFSGDVKVIGKGTVLEAQKSDSLGSSPSVQLIDNSTYLTAQAYTQANVDLISDDSIGTFAAAQDSAGALDLKGGGWNNAGNKPGLYIHASPGTSATISHAIEPAEIDSTGTQRYQFGGGGGVLFVDSDLTGGDDIKTKGPGVTVLRGNNEFGDIDTSEGGLGIGSDYALGGTTSSRKHVYVTWNGEPADDPSQLLYSKNESGDWQHGMTSTRAYEVHLQGGNVGFLGDFTLDDFDKLGVIEAVGPGHILGIGAQGDSGTVTAAVDIEDYGNNTTWLVKRGDSTLDLTPSANTYTGYTLVFSGELKVDNADQLSTNQIELYSQTTQRSTPGLLHFADDVTWTADSGKPFGFARQDAGRFQTAGTESTVEVDSGYTATIDGDIKTFKTGGRLRKTGGGTLVMDSITLDKGWEHSWGLNIEEGEVHVNQLPYYSNDVEEGNGILILSGGTLVCLPETGAEHWDDQEGVWVDPTTESDYGFGGWRIAEDTTNTIRVEGGGLFQATAKFQSPHNWWHGTLVFEGLESSPGEGDWGEMRLANDDGEMSNYSTGGLHLKSGNLVFDGARQQDMIPDDERFTMTLDGGRISARAGYSSLHGDLNVDANTADDLTPEIASLSAYSGGDTNWTGGGAATVSSTLTIGRNEDSTTTVGSGGFDLTVESGGTFNVGGSTDPLYDAVGDRAVTLANEGNFDVSGTATVDSVSGAGNVDVIGSATATSETEYEVDPAQLAIKQQSSAWAYSNTQSTLDMRVDEVIYDTDPDDPESEDVTVATDVLAGQLDVTNNKVLFTDETEADIMELVLAGRNGGTWDGLGITSSSLTDGRAVGVKETTEGTAVGYTAAGDATMDGKVSLADLSTLGDNWGSEDATWSMGDFSYDGKVSLADLSILGDYWGEDISNDVFGSTAVVPEPATLSVLALGGLAVCFRRRRK